MPSVISTIPPSDAAEYEATHVHAIYEQIAPHFSSTRYKPWPVIASFLTNLPPGWIGLDSGTGNGKYLPLGPVHNPNAIMTIGLDKSFNLLKIAQNAGSGSARREVVRANVLDRCWREGIFDYAISIATIHHLATYERRKQAVQRLLQAVSPSHGRILIYVWAIEQDELSKREIPLTNTQAQQSRHDQDGKDVFVPWVLASSTSTSSNMKDNTRTQTLEIAKGGTEQQVFNRYYHMFAKGELRRLVEDAAEEMGLFVGLDHWTNTPKQKESDKKARGIDFIQDSWERSNYYVELRCWVT
ncbi:hypothetical protein GYMLUDRAFT_97515 [Collybiopsis luxurians FD-317 M1]|uniref:Methyltransferase type 11 domain-containing protein n=1 Tax=Collybiopsis luxurians FD-317 M1 TaxID=944289 RepID=A0A0D0B8C0_9AGAR|nr:hypothetical protein GYMLUDRAFT_97515 [Collybiopsis luxurians FD-317 M1]